MLVSVVAMLSRLWEADGPRDGGRRRGGWRQQAAAAAAEAAAADDELMSKLASRQLLRWADGEVSASRLQETMQDAVADGLTQRMVMRMSLVGQGQHAHQGLLALLARRTAVLDNIQPIDGATRDAASHILLPSSILRCLRLHYPEEFRRRLGADRGLITSFWDQLCTARNHRWVSEHPILSTMTREQRSMLVPLTLHEDAGPITKKSSANCISFSAVLGQGNEKLTHFLCATYVKRNRDDNVDNNPMWRALLSDLEALAVGGVGEEGWRFLVLFAKADEQVRCDEWGLTHYNAADEVCSECRANRTSRPWTDMRRASLWRGTENMDATTYRNRIPAPPHPLADSRLFWMILFALDIMHVLDCKGVSATIFGSLLGMLIRLPRLGANQQARVATINARMLAWYGARPGSHRLPRLTMANIVAKGSGWHELAGPAIKAANTRNAAPMFASMAREYMDDASAESRAVVRVTQALADMYEVLRAAPMFLDDATLHQFRELVGGFGVSLQYLRSWAETNHRLMWQVRPKAHKAMHLPQLAAIINPRYVDNYADESQIGTSTRVWKGSVAGRYKAHVQRTVLAKRWLAVLLRYERGD